MTRRTLLRTPFAALPALAQTSARRPNFLFVLTDDQRWDSLSATGHPFADTPNMDRLLREGARFTNAFVTTSLCSPSRASFLTGQYAHTHGVRDNFGDIRETAWTFPKALQQSGYETAFVGKWHMGYDKDEPRPGFDHWVSFKGQGPYFDPELNVNGKRERVKGYTNDILNDQAAEWIRQRGERPFLAYVSHKAVHNPRTPAPRHKGLYSGADYPLPASYGDDYAGKPQWQGQRRASRTGVDGGLARYDGSLSEYVRDTQRTLKSVDEGLGALLEALEESGKLDDTVVIFAGDNGFFFGEHGFINKRAAYEESIRIPFLVRYPRLVKAGSQVDAMTLNIDLAPSVLDLAGVQAPKEMLMQGVSWKPLLSGEPTPRRRAWLYEYFYEPRFAPTPSMQGVRTERWKYVRYPNLDEVDELYDLAEDPHELRNLAADPRASRDLDGMRKQLYGLLAKTQGL